MWILYIVYFKVVICLDFPLNYLCFSIRNLNYDFVTLLKIAEAIALKLVGD